MDRDLVYVARARPAGQELIYWLIGQFPGLALKTCYELLME